ncbi:glycosyl hydrolase 115 family protein [Caulobacter sp. S45]|uniref:glycosyl hydrolase 115 family protein n=1 Tax=Caulobacter sp. S45 TaxID=1641861 RepID=UPI0020B16EA3|nr:glycosyl hydrolase 115 family protein [Caulobacter sp. S45]
MAIAAAILMSSPASAIEVQSSCLGAAAVCEGGSTAAFALIAQGRPAILAVDAGDLPGVGRAADDVRADLARLAGGTASPDTTIIAGTLGHNPVIDRLVREGRLDVSGVAGRWEAFVQQVVEHPAPGIERALVIAGADRRGTIFGLYDLSERAGVSPWAWWADVPVPHRPDLYVTAGRRVEAPAVRYRGIFLNDEDPSLKGWVDATYGGFNHRFYAKVFELTLRMKGNFLWPAMWGKAFADDDAESPGLANAYGVVMGTSHHEPMARNQAEWTRYGKGPWDYTQNADVLRGFWRKGIERLGSNEALVTVGMRGDGDKPMTEGSPIQLLEKIVADQRKIIGDVTHLDPARTPQVWAIYKEVQDYYDHGMRVPDDVTLLFSDDNWGDLRRLPELGHTRAGGYGVYYHFDYVGGPRNYKWINTNQVERIWEQMHLAHAYGADQLWIVNVGDLKPMELPIQFFLDYAWNPDAWPVDKLGDYTRQWAAEQFGAVHSAEIAELLTRYTQYNARRKPELLEPTTYSLTDYREAERVADAYEALAAKARVIRAQLPPGYDDAFVELVLYPVEASANLNRLYVTTGLNRLYAAQGRAATNRTAVEVKALFQRDEALTHLYNDEVAHGKWTHMMDQTHIGYTSWRDPKVNIMPKLQTLALPAAGALGVAVEGDARAWPAAPGAPRLSFDRYGAASRYIEVFDRGAGPIRYAISGGAPWLRVSDPEGDVGEQKRLLVLVDWSRAPTGHGEASLTVRGSDGTAVTVAVSADNAAAQVSKDGGEAFVEGDGYVAIEAAHYARAVEAGGVGWGVVPDLGRTVSGVTSFPVTAPSQAPGAGAHLDYAVILTKGGPVAVQVAVAPSLDFRGKGGLRYAVSIDGGAPQVVNLEGDPSKDAWDRSVADNARVLVTRFPTVVAGPHVVRLWRVDPGVVFERVVLDLGGVKPSYLGPPESQRLGAP